MDKTTPIVIAIDGLSGSGKSTLARALAKRLGYSYLDTGAMYRALTYKALKRRMDFSKPEALYACVKDCKLRLTPGGQRIWLDGDEISRQIRGVRVSQHVSLLASVPKIRERLVHMQRAIAREHPVVMEGRDIGTVVFPKADIKFFIVASLDERTNRRLAEMRQMGSKARHDTILKNLADRDTLDSGRKTSPLRRADDAILIDSTNMTVEEKTEHALKIIRQRLAKG
jgi:CMP/dCMP kinase